MPPPPGAAPDQGVQVLTRGPVHEAFAQPVLYDPQPGVVAPQAPPQDVSEMPPDQMAQGAQWIPGYWSWDQDANQYIWVSGVWRIPPPNCSWVPGYWAQVQNGFQWVPGFWTTSQTEEFEYLPQPPRNVIESPPANPPSPSSIWIPGHWLWRDSRYMWRAGSWVNANPDWVYTPSHYCWTPNGYIYLDGYWDYPLDRRGVLFAPVQFDSPIYEARDYYYTPSVVIDVRLLLGSLFLQPRYDSYFFGDYYGPEYVRRGFHPWYEAAEYRTWYDPIYFHERWRHRDDDRWGRDIREGYERRDRDRDLRPARTYSDMERQVARMNERQRGEAQFARPLNEVVSSRGSTVKFQAVPQERRQQEAVKARTVHEYARQRTQWETGKTSERPSPPPRARETPPPAKTPSPEVRPPENVPPRGTPAPTTPPRVAPTPQPPVPPRATPSPTMPPRARETTPPENAPRETTPPRAAPEPRETPAPKETTPGPKRVKAEKSPVRGDGEGRATPPPRPNLPEPKERPAGKPDGSNVNEVPEKSPGTEKPDKSKNK